MKKTNLIVVSAPSGAGKSSLVERALKDFKELVDSVSCTTRAPRPGEQEGNPYHFMDRAKFLELKAQGHFIETADVHGHFYGTPKHQLEDAWKLGKWLIMDVDVQGADSFRALYPNATYIFILPPSIDELRRRLEKRDKGKTTNLEVRLKNAEKEMGEASKFDRQIVNVDFDETYSQFKKIIEELVKSR